MHGQRTEMSIHNVARTLDEVHAARLRLEARLLSQSHRGGWPGPAELKESLRKGVSEGNDPVLARLYRGSWEAEQHYRRQLVEHVKQHGVADWLLGIRDLPLVDVARLILQLDVRRAQTVSAFWRYCGMAPREVQGGGDTYSQRAGRLCGQIGLALTRGDGAYARYFAAELAKLEHFRPEIAVQQREERTRRKTVKLFLRHLWLVWRQAEGLAVTTPADEHTDGIDPWAMVEPATARCA
jgi:hypothetical protein